MACAKLGIKLQFPLFFHGPFPISNLIVFCFRFGKSMTDEIAASAAAVLITLNHHNDNLEKLIRLLGERDKNTKKLAEYRKLRKDFYDGRKGRPGKPTNNDRKKLDVWEEVIEACTKKLTDVNFSADIKALQLSVKEISALASKNR